LKVNKLPINKELLTLLMTI